MTVMWQNLRRYINCVGFTTKDELRYSFDYHTDRPTQVVTGQYAITQPRISVSTASDSR